MEKVVRRWTEEEQQKLFEDYFRLSPTLCPICGHEVSILLSCLGEKVTVLLQCHGCDNRGTASRFLKHLSPLVGQPTPSKVCPIDRF